MAVATHVWCADGMSVRLAGDRGDAKDAQQKKNAIKEKYGLKTLLEFSAVLRPHIRWPQIAASSPHHYL